MNCIWVSGCWLMLGGAIYQLFNGENKLLFMVWSKYKTILYIHGNQHLYTYIHSCDLLSNFFQWFNNIFSVITLKFALNFWLKTCRKIYFLVIVIQYTNNAGYWREFSYPGLNTKNCPAWFMTGLNPKNCPAWFMNRNQKYNIGGDRHCLFT